MSSEVLLSVTGLQVNYGAVAALRGIDVEVRRGEIVALVGANGAGKSTLLKTLSGLLRPARGSARFQSLDLARTSPHKIVAGGLVHVPEGRHVFAKFGLADNLRAGAFTSGFAAATEKAEQIVRSNPLLARRADSLAGQLSGGEQQMLVILRALMADPTMVMLDEPSMGLSPKLADDVLELVAGLRNEGRTVLLVEQNALAALDIADRVYALSAGRVIYHDTPGVLRANPDFAEQFLGVVSAEVREGADDEGSGEHS